MRGTVRFDWILQTLVIESFGREFARLPSIFSKRSAAAGGCAGRIVIF